MPNNDKHEDKLKHICAEIISTEENVKMITENTIALLNNLIEDMKEHPSKYDEVERTVILKELDQQLVFLECYKILTNYYNELNEIVVSERAVLMTAKIAEVLNQEIEVKDSTGNTIKVNISKVFTEYSVTHYAFIALMIIIKSRDPNLYFHKLTKKSNMTFQDICTLSIASIQRPPRWALLSKELLKNTTVDDKKDKISASLYIIESKLAEANKHKAEQEECKKIKEIKMIFTQDKFEVYKSLTARNEWHSARNKYETPDNTMTKEGNTMTKEGAQERIMIANLLYKHHPNRKNMKMKSPLNKSEASFGTLECHAMADIYQRMLFNGEITQEIGLIQALRNTLLSYDHESIKETVNNLSIKMFNSDEFKSLDEGSKKIFYEIATIPNNETNDADHLNRMQRLMQFYFTEMHNPKVNSAFYDALVGEARIKFMKPVEDIVYQKDTIAEPQPLPKPAVATNEESNDVIMGNEPSSKKVPTDVPSTKQKSPMLSSSIFVPLDDEESTNKATDENKNSTSSRKRKKTTTPTSNIFVPIDDEPSSKRARDDRGPRERARIEKMVRDLHNKNTKKHSDHDFQHSHQAARKHRGNHRRQLDYERHQGKYHHSNSPRHK